MTKWKEEDDEEDYEVEETETNRFGRWSVPYSSPPNPHFRTMHVAIDDDATAQVQIGVHGESAIHGHRPTL